MSSKIAMKECYGCRISVRQPLYYDGDGETAWCSECFVTEEMLEAARAQMPCWQGLIEKPKKKVAIRLVKASVAAVPPTVAVAPSSEPSAQLAPASSPPLVQKAKKKPVLMAKTSVAPSVPLAAPSVPLAAPSVPPSAPPAQPQAQKKKPVLLKKVVAATEQSAPLQVSAAPPVEKKKPRLCKKNTPQESPQSPA